MAHAAHDPAFASLIAPHAPLRQLGTGFAFTEGPIWHPREGYLLFSDMPGDVRRRWDGAGVTEAMRPSNKGNGMTLDAGLRLLVCEHATSSVARFEGGRREVLASHFDGRELNSPNDLCVADDGAIWFTDPTYGRMPVYGVERPVQLGFQGVYRIPPEGGPPALMVDRWTFTQPNGLCFSPDGATLYVNDTVQACIRAYAVGAGGRLSGERLFAGGIVDALRPGVPDGMKCDMLGNVWVTGPGGVWVYAPDGRKLGEVGCPELVANLAWGGADWRTLFLCATTSLYAVQTIVGPRVEPYMRSHAAPLAGGLALAPERCALVIQDMQNDVVMAGGAFAASGAPEHCAAQNAIANCARLAAAARARGVPVIHVWFEVEPGAPGLTLNAPLFRGLLEARALVRGTWGAQAVEGLAPQPGDHVVRKMRMSAFEGSTLETVLRATGRDTLVVTGAWTNMSIEHTARTGADKGYRVVIPQDCCATMNADWHRASIDYAMRNVAEVSDADAVIAALGR